MSANAGNGRSSSRPARGGAFNTTNRYGPCRPAGVCRNQPARVRLRARAGVPRCTWAVGLRSSIRCRFPCRPIFELYVVAPSRMLAGNASANVCRIDRADARRASARAHPIVAVIHGYRTSFLNDRRRGRLRIQASTVISHDMSDRTACRASPVNDRKVDRTLRRRERVRRREDGRAPGRPEDAQAPGSLQRGVDVGVLRVVEAQLLQQRDVDRVGVGMEELGAEIDGDSPPLVLDHPRIAMAADPGSRLEEVDVEAVGQKVGCGHAARTGADDRHAFTPRPWSPASGGAGRQGAEGRQADRALEGTAASYRRLGHGKLGRLFHGGDPGLPEPSRA